MGPLALTPAITRGLADRRAPGVLLSSSRLAITIRRPHMPHGTQAESDANPYSAEAAAAVAVRPAALTAPRVPLDLVVRERLFDLVSKGAAGPLTLVSAPAGTGKTALVSAW